jgi:hypothetical protein
MYSPTGQMLNQLIYSQINEVTDKDTKSPIIKKTMQTIFVINAK